MGRALSSQLALALQRQLSAYLTFFFFRPHISAACPQINPVIQMPILIFWFLGVALTRK